jgi:bacterioferritin
MKEDNMKGNPKLIETLNALLADELTAISQYMVHSEMAHNWGYEKLHLHFEKRAIDEMKHAEILIGRIIFLEGIPIVSKLNKMSIGADVPKQLAGDRGLEMGAIKSYNEAIVLAGDVRDFATREILEKILNDEDRHIDQIEELQDQISQMSLQIFLTTQVG